MRYNLVHYSADYFAGKPALRYGRSLQHEPGTAELPRLRSIQSSSAAPSMHRQRLRISIAHDCPLRQPASHLVGWQNRLVNG